MVQFTCSRSTTNTSHRAPVQNDSHYFVTADNTVVACTRCWGWRQGFPQDPSTKERTGQALLSSVPAVVAEMLMQRRERLLIFRCLQDNSFARIMEAVRESKYYNRDLNEQDVLELIPRGLALSSDHPGYLCCLFCKSKNQLTQHKIFPTGHGLRSHFKRPRHDAREPRAEPPPPQPMPDPVARSHPAATVPSPPPPPPPKSKAPPPCATIPAEPKSPPAPSPKPYTAFPRPAQAAAPIVSGGYAPPTPVPVSSSRPQPPPFPPPSSAASSDEPQDDLPRTPRSEEAEVPETPPPPHPEYEPSRDCAQQMSYLPQIADYEEIPLTKEGILQELQSAPTQSWIRALANFQVLGSPVVLGGLNHQEQRPLWSKRVRDISMVPALFKAITKVRTDKGLMWERILTVRQVLTKEGKVTVAVGHGEHYEELEGPTNMHGLVGALFAKNVES